MEQLPPEPKPQTLGEASIRADRWLRQRLLLGILGHPFLALAVLGAFVALAVFVISGRPDDPDPAVERYLVVRGFDRVAVDCAGTNSREDGHPVYSCSVTSEDVELADGDVGLVPECYVVDGKNAYPAAGRC